MERTEFPSKLYLFSQEVYGIEPVIDAALLLKPAQREAIMTAVRRATAATTLAPNELREDPREVAKRKARAQAHVVAELVRTAKAQLDEQQAELVRRVNAGYDEAERHADAVLQLMVAQAGDRRSPRMLRTQLIELAFRNALTALLNDTQERALGEERQRRDATPAPRRVITRPGRPPQSPEPSKSFDLFTPDAKFDLVNAYLLSLVNLFLFPDALFGYLEGLDEDEYGVSSERDYVNIPLFDKHFRTMFQNLGLDEVHPIHPEPGNFDLTDTEAAVMANKDVVIVAFRGTENHTSSFLMDWFGTNIRIAPIPRPQLGSHVTVHAGFWSATDAVYERVRNKIAAVGGMSGKKLWITGHSLGGALAQVFALRYALDKRLKDGHTPYAPHCVYTYGAPRVGNLFFVTALQSQIPLCFRWVNRADLIPMLPPDAPPNHILALLQSDHPLHKLLEPVLGPELPAKLFEYRHAGSTVNIKNDGTIRSPDDEYRGFDGTWELHAPILYCKAIYKHQDIPNEIWDNLPEPPKLSD